MPARDVPERFAVAFSLAGEQRHVVLPVAQEVEAILGKSTVFYDGWYEHWIAGNDADLLLQRIYSEMAELVVFCVSGTYGAKSWTRTEHRAIRARLMESASPADRSRVLPVRVDDGLVEGVLANEIVPDLRKKSPTEAAELIIARLNLVRGPRDAASPPGQWPVNAPVLHWPMADHSEARAAFASFLTATTPFRALLIQGPSETGKTHMSRQMMRNVIGLPGVDCGRFDFKGTTNMNVEVESFAQPLGIEPPDGQTLNERLGRIFGELRRRAQPTVLVFDAYEAAGDVQAWIENVLLQYLVSATWLRVVVIGQTVPIRAGTTWETVAATTIRLRAPGLDDWFAYGRENRGTDVDLDFVTKAHANADGKAAVLAALLGPRS